MTLIITFIVFFIAGVVLLWSSRWSIDPKERSNMPPADIELITRELDIREEVGVLSLLFSAFALFFMLLL